MLMIILLDQYTKFLAQSKLKNKKAYTLKEGILEFKYIENTGAAYGIFKGKRKLIIGIGLFTLLLVAKLFYDALILNQVGLYKLSLSMIMGGAVGNLADRIRLHYVIDFIYIKIKKFAVFNVADLFIINGALMFCYSVLYYGIDL